MKSNSGMTFLAVVICALAGIVAPTAARATGDEDFVRTYTWVHGGETYGFSYRIPWKTYNFYQEKPRVYHNYAVYTYEHAEHTFLDGFAKALTMEAKGKGMDEWQTINFVVSFVQGLQYKKETGEYPKFPVETLADKGGDCEDTAILLAGLLERMGYDAVLVNPPGHMAVALACKNCKGSAFEQSGRRYFYIETTSAGFSVGELPKEYAEKEVKLIRLRATDEELWVLRANPEDYKQRTPVYYVLDEGDSGVVHSGETRIVTTTTVRTVTINGKTYTTTTVRRHLE